MISKLIQDIVTLYCQSRRLLRALYQNLSYGALNTQEDSVSILTIIRLLTVLNILTLSITESFPGTLNPKEDLSKCHGIEDENSLYEKDTLMTFLRALLHRSLNITVNRNKAMRLVLALRFITKEYAAKKLQLSLSEFALLSKILGLEKIYPLRKDSIHIYNEHSLGASLLRLNTLIWELYEILAPLVFRTFPSEKPRLEYIYKSISHLKDLGWHFPPLLKEFYISLKSNDLWYGHFILRVKKRIIWSIENIYPPTLKNISILYSEECFIKLEPLLKQLMPAIVKGLIDVSLVKLKKDEYLFMLHVIPSDNLLQYLM